MTRCSHCGLEHFAGETRCPITGELLSRPGPIGTQLDRYQIELLLGSGGFGSVYRARHQHTHQLVALKTLKRQLSQDPQMVERFLREARAAASVGSEHIVRVMDAGLSPDGTAFLAMELLEGHDLQQVDVKRGAMGPAQLVDILAQVLDALEAAHQAGIVHRDLKPANVFLVNRPDASGQARPFVKLLDFGISKMQESMSTGAGITQAGIAMGTPGYMAPEQFFDARSVDARADIYSVGAMAYLLFTGRLPIEFTSLPDLIVKVKTEVPPPLATVAPALPAALCAAVDKALARTAGERWQSAREFAAALRAAGGIPVVQKLATPARLEVAAAPAGASMMFGATSVPRQLATNPPPPAPAPGPAAPVALLKSVLAQAPSQASAMLGRVGIRSQRARLAFAAAAAVMVLAVVLASSRGSRPGRSRGTGPEVSHWKLVSNTCPPGTAPALVETTTTGNQFVSRSAGFPDATGTVGTDGRFRAHNGLGTCHGSFTESTATETCTSIFRQSCFLTYERAD